MEKHSPSIALSDAETRRRLVELGALAKLAPTAAARIELNRLADRLVKQAARGGDWSGHAVNNDNPAADQDE